MDKRVRWLIPIAVGLLASALLAVLYFAIVSLAESPQHALDLFWEDRLLVIPILLGFGVQAGLYSVLKTRLYLPASVHEGSISSAPGASMGAGGATSTVAMIACCAHHAADVFPILGLTAAAAFLAEYQTAFMVAGLATNLIGIGVISYILIRARRTVLVQTANPRFASEES